MTSAVFHITYTAHATVTRGCCGLSDAICNCQPPDQCACTAPEED